MKPFVLLQGPYNPKTETYDTTETPYWTSSKDNILIYEKVVGSEDEEYNEDKDINEIFATYFPVGLQVYKTTDKYSETRTVPGNCYSYNVEKYPSMLPWRQRDYDAKSEVPKSWYDLKPHQLLLHRNKIWDEKKNNYYSYIPGTEKDYLIVKTSKGWDSDVLGEWNMISRDREGVPLYDTTTLKRVGITSSGESAKKWSSAYARVKGQPSGVWSRWLVPLYRPYPSLPPTTKFQKEMAKMLKDIGSDDVGRAQRIGRKANLYLASDFVPLLRKSVELWIKYSRLLGVDERPVLKMINYFKGSGIKELPTPDQLLKMFDTPFWKGQELSRQAEKLAKQQPDKWEEYQNKMIFPFSEVWGPNGGTEAQHIKYAQDYARWIFGTFLSPVQKEVLLTIGYGSRFNACLVSLDYFVNTPEFSEINKKRREIRDSVEPVLVRAKQWVEDLVHSPRFDKPPITHTPPDFRETHFGYFNTKEQLDNEMANPDDPANLGADYGSAVDGKSFRDFRPEYRSPSEMVSYWRIIDASLAKFASKASLKDIKDSIEFQLGMVQVTIQNMDALLAKK